MADVQNKPAIDVDTVGKNLVRLRFVKILKPTEKGPKYRYLVMLNDPRVPGVALSGPIWIKDGGTPQPGLPTSYGDDVIQATPIVEMFNNHEFSRLDPEGVATLERWVPTVRVAFMSYQQTGKAEQVVSFRQ